jgi:hypothetical protein
MSLEWLPSCVSQNAIYWVWKELANTSDSIVTKVVKDTGFSLSKKSVECFS